ncbi:hypothetical protein KIF24_07130 [Micromonospora sp. Llam7]|uniref:hypothetical protein n=1 Tax=Micromonospora tarapacensis TaxID=2835305 RepID=UPI001C82B37A|nr:hypothetical protein [Micromonospora tarapacensis]MBX7265824.1 hypothetical protein [Micromonospora tarapacensis]
MRPAPAAGSDPLARLVAQHRVPPAAGLDPRRRAGVGGGDGAGPGAGAGCGPGWLVTGPPYAEAAVAAAESATAPAGPAACVTPLPAGSISSSEGYTSPRGAGSR